LEKLASLIFASVGAMLIFGILPLGYDYYVLLRGAVTVAAAVLAYVAVIGQRFPWLILALPSFILWFPPFGVELEKSTWMVLDLIAGIAFVVASRSFREGPAANTPEEQ
jgi:hypothetical protein